MCNAYEQRVAFADYEAALRASHLGASTAQSAADLPIVDEIHIGDTGPVLRAAGNGVELLPMRFGWPPPRPHAGPVFNFRSDGRRFDGSKRCLVVLSAFFEFTGARYPKAKHRFALAAAPVMAIAGLWSEAPDGTLGFTLLTTAPGPDIAPYHDRQVCVLAPPDWAAWLFLTRPEAELLRPLPAGALDVVTLRAASD